jgi:hypothetical protein
MILKIILKKERVKLQAASFKLDSTVGYDRINLERNNYETNKYKHNN